MLTQRTRADFAWNFSRGTGDARVVSFRVYLPPLTPEPPRFVAVSGFNVEHRLVQVCWQQ